MKTMTKVSDYSRRFSRLLLILALVVLITGCDNETTVTADNSIETEILEVIYSHFEAIEEKDEAKYNNTLLNPDYTNSTWTWDFAIERGISYKITELTSNGIGSLSINCYIEFFDDVTGTTMKMSPTFLLTQTPSGYKIHDID